MEGYNILEQFPFEEFWELYGKKVGRFNCQKKYSKLTHQERMAIFEHVPRYVESTPDITFRKNPQTYLNGRCWEDEVIYKSKPIGKMETLYSASKEVDRILDERNANEQRN